jgi:uncharacterized protein YegL
MKNYTDLNIILDRSGSMSSIAKDMVGGIKTFLDKEKETGDDTKVSFYQFDDQYETIFVDKDIKDKINIDLVPRGSTALLDALGRTIVSVGEKLSKLDEKDRPNRVLFLVITDGYENASREFSSDVVKEKVKHQREKYAWDFVFLGAGEDAVLAQHKGLGIGASSSKGFAKDAKSINLAWTTVSDSYQMYKTLDRNNVATYCSTFEMKEDQKDEDKNEGSVTKNSTATL